MNDRIRATIIGQIVAVLATLIAVLLRSVMDPWLGNNLPFVTLFGAVAVGVWFGGYRAGLTAAVIGFLACDFFFIPPRHSFAIHGSGQYIGLVLYFFTCAIIVFFGQAVRDSRRRALVEQERLLVTLTSIGDGVITTDAEGRVVLLNPVAESLTGWSSAEAAGQELQAVFRIVNEKTRQPVDNPVEKVLATGKIVGLANHTVLIAKDGMERPIDDSAAPIRDAAGRIIGVVLVFRDVIEQRTAERNSRLLASIVESSEDAIIGKDINGVITSWNRSAERLFGYSAKEAVGQSVQMLAPAERSGEMPAILSRIRNGERVEHFDTVRRAKDGRLIPISLTVSPIKNEDGEIVGASKIARDISERRRAEDALREEKARLHTTLVSIGDGVIVTDSQGRVTMLNPVAQALTGWNDEAVGRPLDDVFRIVNEQTRETVEAPVKKVLAEGVVVALANHTVLIARNGAEIPIDDSAAPIKDAQGRVVGCVLIFRDISSCRSSEQSLRASEDRLRLALNAGNMGTWEWNVRTNEVIWSPGLEEIHGLTPGSFPGTFEAYQKDMHPDDRDHVLSSISQSVVRGLDHHVEYRIVLPDQRTRWVEGRGKLFYDANGKPERMIGVCTDITTRKQAEEALRAAEERFRTMADAAPVLIWLSGTDKRCTWFNKRWLEFVGRPMEKELDNGWMENVHPDDFRACLQVYESSFDARQEFTMEYRLKRHDGEYRWLLDHGTPLYGAGGEFTGYIGSCIDITDHKQAELGLLEAMQKLQIVTNTMSAAVTRCSRDMRYLWVSKPYADWIGRKPDEMIGRPIVEILGREAFERLAPRFHQVVSGEDVHYEEELNFHGIGRRWINAAYTPTFGPDGSVDGWVAVVVDTTEYKRMEQALREADRHKNEFIATLAHELRNPLAPIRNAVQILRTKGSSDPDLLWSRDVIDRQVQHMARLLEDLLDVSRVSRNKIVLRKERVDLAGIVQNAVETSQPLIANGRHEMRVDLPEQAIALEGDPVRLAQVFSNLLNNAAKYTKAGGEIRLSARREGNEVAVSVCDNGIGMSAEILPRIFDIFAQGQPALERSQGGLGIGLSLVKRLVEMHGGTIEAKSDGPGMGSTFIVHLPVIAEDLPATREPKDEDEVIPAGRYRILIADDIQDSADSLAMLLRMMGHEVFTAYDGEDALIAAEKFNPEFVLLDIGMPKMNGYEACRRIREHSWSNEMFLIALTGWAQDDDRRRTEEAGFHAHLIKPVSSTALLQTMAALRARSS